mmetsp:Transcript_7041/g.12713  ORF Transcript_7041/g.12713 Transcript_7041/m.12713 type:complete len:82 (-) Transcript_7041:8-253(-)
MGSKEGGSGQKKFREEVLAVDDLRAFGQVVNTDEVDSQARSPSEPSPESLSIISMFVMGSGFGSAYLLTLLAGTTAASFFP